MKTNRSKMSSRNPLAESRWLILALATLFALPPAVLATPRVTVSLRKLAHAATTAPPEQIGYLFEVNTTGDGDRVSGGALCDADAATPGDQCTLRAAIQTANANVGEDGIDIVIPATDPGCDAGTGKCVINLTKALPSLNTDMAINGPGADKLTVRRSTGGDYRIFNVTATGVVTLSGMTISNGHPLGDGGGIQNFNAGTVNVTACAITDNVASRFGGGIHNRSNGQVSLNNSLLARNSAIGVESDCCSYGQGGGIANSTTGVVGVTNSTITGNSAVGAAGRQFTSPGDGRGGGIYNAAGTVYLSHSTISGNSATAIAGGQGQGGGYGGGIVNTGGATVNLRNTILANNTALTSGPDASGGLTSNSFNLIENTSGAVFDSTSSDILGVDPKLGPLQNNGGPTPTMALLSGSPAIDRGTNVSRSIVPLATDQRGDGFPRTFDDPSIANAPGIYGTGTDIGAFELHPAVQFSTSAYTVNEGTAIATIIVKRTGSLHQAATVHYATANVTAIAGKDYTATSGTLSFAVGEASKTFTVPIINDTLDEVDETVKLKLSNPTGGVMLGTPGTALLKIVDNDLPPKLSITNATVTEGNSGALYPTFTISLSATSGKTVTVRYATANGTAKAPGDYAARAGTLSFAPGQTSKTLTVGVRGDLLDEANETFFVNLTSPVNATFADNQGLGTILDDD